MVDLKALSPCHDLLPRSIGDVAITEGTADHITALMPYRGQQEALSAALKDAHGMGFPAPGRATGREGARCVWAGKGQALLIGPAPSDSLSRHSAVVDQSDAWAMLRVEGAGGEDALARLIPLDLRGTHFKRGHSVRSLMQHVSVSVTRTGEASFLILGFRSMAQTMVHELCEAAEALAQRKALS